MKKLLGIFKKKSNTEFFSDEMIKEISNRSNDKNLKGRTTINIVDAANKKITLSSFKVIDKLGGGSFGSVFLVRPQGKSKNP